MEGAETEAENIQGTLRTSRGPPCAPSRLCPRAHLNHPHLSSALGQSHEGLGNEDFALVSHFQSLALLYIVPISDARSVNRLSYFLLLFASLTNRMYFYNHLASTMC